MRSEIFMDTIQVEVGEMLHKFLHVFFLQKFFVTIFCTQVAQLSYGKNQRWVNGWIFVCAGMQTQTSTNNRFFTFKILWTPSSLLPLPTPKKGYTDTAQRWDESEVWSLKTWRALMKRRKSWWRLSISWRPRMKYGLGKKTCSWVFSEWICTGSWVDIIVFFQRERYHLGRTRWIRSLIAYV